MKQNRFVLSPTNGFCPFTLPAGLLQAAGQKLDLLKVSTKASLGALVERIAPDTLIIGAARNILRVPREANLATVSGDLSDCGRGVSWNFQDSCNPDSDAFMEAGSRPKV